MSNRALIFIAIWLVAFETITAAFLPTDESVLLKKRKPLRIDFCKGLGYDETSKINYFYETSQENAMKNPVFKAFQLLEKTGCSRLVKRFACGIYAPAVHAIYGALPPCRSTCTAVESSCVQYLKFSQAFKKSAFSENLKCNHFPVPSSKAGCVDFELDEDKDVYKMKIKGTPKESQLDDWVLPTF